MEHARAPDPVGLRIRISGTETDRARTLWWECPGCHAWGTKRVSAESPLDDVSDALRGEHAHTGPGTPDTSDTAPGIAARTGAGTAAEDTGAAHPGRVDADDPPAPSTDDAPTRRPRWNAAVGHLLKLRPPWAA